MNSLFRALLGVVILAFLATPPSVRAASADSTKLPSKPVVRPTPFPPPNFPENQALAAERLARQAYLDAPVTDGQGRVQYIVLLDRKAVDETVSRNAAAARIDSIAKPYHRQATRESVAQIEEAVGFLASQVLSTVIEGFVAALDENQVNRVKQDPRVLGVEPVRRIGLSGNLWQDWVWTPGEIWPWGVQAVGGPVVRYDDSPVIVLDSGVDTHNDLWYAERYRVGNVSAIGCYQHATFIAGVISAASATYSGTVGVRPFTPIQSIAYRDDDVESLCFESGTSSDLIAGFELARNLVSLRCLQQGDCRPGVLNLSSNSALLTACPGGVGRQCAFLWSIHALTTPTLDYPGILVVHSAGNQNMDARLYTLAVVDYPGQRDGYLRVGGHDENGQPVVPISDVGFWNPPSNFSINSPFVADPNPSGSNFGQFVDVWAPSRFVKSTVGEVGNSVGWRVGIGSGTSFAAPHISALAAKVRETVPQWTTPAGLEEALRQTFFWNGARDSAGSNVVTANAAGTTHRAKPTLEFYAGGGGVPPGAIPSASTLNLTNAWNQTLYLTLDGRGAGQGSCEVIGTANAMTFYWEYGVSLPHAMEWTPGGPAGPVVFTAYCRDPLDPSVFGVASANVTLTEPPPEPTIRFYLDNIEMTWPPRSAADAPYVVTAPPGGLGTFLMRVEMIGMTYCDVTLWAGGYYPWIAGDIDYPWVVAGPYPTMTPNLHDWGLVGLEPSRHTWVASCTTAIDGRTVIARTHVTIQ